VSTLILPSQGVSASTCHRMRPSRFGRHGQSRHAK
jgi:hypothetical protein